MSFAYTPRVSHTKTVIALSEHHLEPVSCSTSLRLREQQITLRNKHSRPQCNSLWFTGHVTKETKTLGTNSAGKMLFYVLIQVISPMLSSFLKEVGKPTCRLLIFCFARPFSVSKANIIRTNCTRVREYKLLHSGKWNRVLREHFRGNTKESFVGSVPMYSRMGKKDNVVVKIKKITTKWKCMPFNCFKICFN